MKRFDLSKYFLLTTWQNENWFLTKNIQGKFAESMSHAYCLADYRLHKSTLYFRVSNFFPLIFYSFDSLTSIFCFVFYLQKYNIICLAISNKIICRLLIQSNEMLNRIKSSSMKNWKSFNASTTTLIRSDFYFPISWRDKSFELFLNFIYFMVEIHSRWATSLL